MLLLLMLLMLLLLLLHLPLMHEPMACIIQSDSTNLLRKAFFPFGTRTTRFGRFDYGVS